jgi:hypothetical protein
MKSLKLLLPVCLLMTFILSSCGGGGHKDQILDYLAVKTKKDANKISLLDFEGKIVAEDEFDASSTIIATNGIIYEKKKDGKIQYYSLSDKKVKPLFDKLFEAGTPFNEDYAVVRDDQGMLSLIDKNGKPAIANLSKLGEYEVLTSGVVSDGLIKFKAADGKWGYANTSGEVVIKPAYNKCDNFVNGNARVLTDKDEFQIIDKKGKKTTFKPEEDVKYSPIAEKSMVYSKKNGEGKYYVGLIGLDGEKIVKDNKYKEAGAPISGMLAVKNDDSWGVIAASNKWEPIGDLRCKFDAEPVISPSGNVIVRVDKKVKLYSNKGELVISLDDYSAALPVSKDKFLGFRDDKFDILDDKGKTITKDSYVWAGGLDDRDVNALVYPDIYLNTLSVNSTFFNFDVLFQKTFINVTTKDIAGLNENSNIENVMQKFPYEKPEASSGVSAGVDYSFYMGTKSTNSKTDSDTETPTETTATESMAATTDVAEPTNSFPGVYYNSYRTTKGSDKFSFEFLFNGSVKTSNYDAAYNQLPATLDPTARLTQINVSFGLKSYNELLKKKMKEKLIAAGWKTTGDDKDSALYFTNGANSNTISLSGSGLKIEFAQPATVMPAAETAAPY